MQESRELALRDAYRSYMADLLKAVAEHKTVTRRWEDLIRTRPEFDAEQVAADLAERIAGD